MALNCASCDNGNGCGCSSQTVSIRTQRYGADDKVIEAAGYHAFTIENIGTVSATLWGVLPLAAADSREYCNIGGRAYDVNIPIQWDEGDDPKWLVVTFFKFNPCQKCNKS